MKRSLMSHVAIFAACARARDPWRPRRMRSAGTDVWIVPMKHVGNRGELRRPAERHRTARATTTSRRSRLKGDAVLYTATDANGKDRHVASSRCPDGKPVRVTDAADERLLADADARREEFFSFDPGRTRFDPAAVAASARRTRRAHASAQRRSQARAITSGPGDHSLVVYVLGERRTRRHARARCRSSTTTTAKRRSSRRTSGRALAKIPGRDAITFQQLVKDSLPWITELDLNSRSDARAGAGAEGCGLSRVGAERRAAHRRSAPRIFRYTDDGWAPSRLREVRREEHLAHRGESEGQLARIRRGGRDDRREPSARRRPGVSTTTSARRRIGTASIVRGIRRRCFIIWPRSAGTGTRLAWDCATGNGQAAVRLAERYARRDRDRPERGHDRAGDAASARDICGGEVRIGASRSEREPRDGRAGAALVRSSTRSFARCGASSCRAACSRRGAIPDARWTPSVDEIVDLFYSVTLAPFWAERTPPGGRGIPVDRASARRARRLRRSR